ncbi:MAG: hypothetical protein CSA65_08680 [Proteobacteria bacterium]|nr:MAG: hypothetical protein CSB49_07070 [Pseudomonadota bacterium]PIE17531.1 MAG: hypothetical protein CSA65_08680 [Pseudomonadota bacterium]
MPQKARPTSIRKPRRPLSLFLLPALLFTVPACGMSAMIRAGTSAARGCAAGARVGARVGARAGARPIPRALPRGAQTARGLRAATTLAPHSGQRATIIGASLGDDATRAMVTRSNDLAAQGAASLGRSGAHRLRPAARHSRKLADQADHAADVFGVDQD